MNIQKFVQIFDQHPLMDEIASSLNDDQPSKLQLSGVIGSEKSVIISHLFKKLKTDFLLILNDKEEAAYAYDDLSNLGLNFQVLFFPPSYKKSIIAGQEVKEQVVQRTTVLNRIANHKRPIIIVTYPQAVVEPIISKSDLEKQKLEINVDDHLSIDFINETLFEYGFERVDFVYQPGQFAVRGSIVDVFSFSNKDPFRIDFFGDQVDSLRTFDIDTQFSKEKMENIILLPNLDNEQNSNSLVGFVSDETVVYGYNILEFLANINQINIDYAKANQEDGKLLINEDVIKKELKTKKNINFGFSTNFEFDSEFKFNTSTQPTFNKKFNLLGDNLKEFNKKGYKIFILSNQEKQIERLQSIFEDTRIKVDFTPLNFTISQGFIDHNLKICCYTDHQIFERYHRFKLNNRKKQRESLTIKEINRLHPGDFVVHIDHGIGKFAGLVTTELNGKTQETIRLVYRDNDSLFVNIHSLHRISKYRGNEGTEPKLSKLGTGAWEKMKSRAKSKLKDIAKDLIALYAKRREEKGFAYSPDSYLQRELEASFIYEDTPDQEKATIAIKEDMENDMPMDRLVCGDVGFGKTEIAIRAAFKAATDSKQVAVLVPTTILALQHYKTFTDRLKDFPVKIEYLSRLKTAAQSKKIIKDLADHKIDIIIGTHRLVSKDIKFADLGLMIVDEEQKFGVSIKEKLKQIKLNVDTLTLTATPIPRTLQFSLMGARDLSIINTPPPNRYPIVTEVHGFNDKIIKEAIEYEIDRGGQVFFIHNRVQNIVDVDQTIKRIVPGVKTGIGHGQMKGPELEKVMLDFINGKFDVLIATTIIESGLDIPNANTIIINHAQNFGLSDLHQLRGRVGRSNKKAFCYLLTPPISTLSTESRRRLKAIEEFSELGSGFNIAMRDLDIRGAGNLLGAEQSGFIADIGFETYHRILNEAVQELKQGEYKDLFEHENKNTAQAFLNINYVKDCTIDTDMELLFPSTYIPGNTERMSLYRELDNINTVEALERFTRGLLDRFGKMPAETQNLLKVLPLRWVAIELAIDKLVLKNNKMICYFVDNIESPFYSSKQFQNLMEYIKQSEYNIQMKQTDKLSIIFNHIEDIAMAHQVLIEIKNFVYK